MMFKLLSQQGLTVYESIKEMPSYMDSNDRMMFLNMRDMVLEGKTYEDVFKPLKHKLESWIYRMLLISHTLISPGQFFDALITMIDDKHTLMLQQQKAKRYPTLVFVLAIVVLIAYVYAILPTYMSIFSTMGQQNVISMWLIERSSNIWAVISFFIGLFIIYVFFSSFLKTIRHALLFRRGHNIVKYFYYYDVLMRMAIYSEQHMTFFQMFEKLHTHETNRKLKATYQQIITQLQLGKDLYDILQTITFMPKEIQMIVPLTTLKNRQQTLTHISNHYKAQYIERTERLQSFIEPILLLLLGILVLFIGYLMYQPIIEFYDSIGTL